MKGAHRPPDGDCVDERWTTGPARPSANAARAAARDPLAERHDLGRIDLRGDAHDRAFMAAVGRVLDLLLPTEPCTSAVHVARSFAHYLWLWLEDAGREYGVQIAPAD